MDPNTTWDLIQESLAEGRIADAAGHTEDLAVWLNRDGFYPTRPHDWVPSGPLRLLMGMKNVPLERIPKDKLDLGWRAAVWEIIGFVMCDLAEGVEDKN